jgi:anti-sigma regulatory factor (Ser/Thr protein kinase)
MEPLRRSLEREVSAVRRARAEVRAWLIDAGCTPPHVDAVEFVVGEFVTEAVENGAGSLVLVAVTVDEDGTRVEVSDGLSLAGSAPSTRTRTLEEVASASGIVDISGGRMLWAEIDA